MRFRTTNKNFDSMLNTRIEDGIVDLTCLFRSYLISNMIWYAKVLDERFTGNIYMLVSI